MTTVREVMSTDLLPIEPTVNLSEAARAMAKHAAGSALVLERGSIVGIVTERDLLRALAESPSADSARVSPVSRWMTRDPVTIGSDAAVGDALNEMLFRGFRHLPVKDGDAVAGVVSMCDLARGLAEP